MRARIGLCLTLVALVSVATLDMDAVRAAKRPCGAPASNFLSGALAAGMPGDDEVYGARASISANKPGLCGPKSASVAWVLVGGGGAGDGWGQIGYGKVGHLGEDTLAEWSGYKVFVQWAKTSGSRLRNKVFRSPQGTHLYKVYYSVSSDRLHFWRDTKHLASTKFDPELVWTQPWSPQFAGETWHRRSDIPGTGSSFVLFSGMEQRTASTSWAPIDALRLAEEPNVARYHRAWVSRPGSMWIWTDPV